VDISLFRQVKIMAAGAGRLKFATHIGRFFRYIPMFPHGRQLDQVITDDEIASANAVPPDVQPTAQHRPWLQL
jgi:hypothetical protein